MTLRVTVSGSELLRRVIWNFQLQYYGILTCNFRYFYLTTNTFFRLMFRVFATRHTHAYYQVLGICMCYVEINASHIHTSRMLQIRCYPSISFVRTIQNLCLTMSFFKHY